MRIAQQRLILELLQTMRDANEKIKQFFQQGKISTVTSLLAGQQDGIAQIIDFIEDIGNEGTQTIALLEAYYKAVYVISEQINNADGSFVDRLQGTINEIVQSVNNELKPRLEVLFLSYKASMCDSLESIWLAAKADPQCDAYFIATPYYDRSSGSVGTFHDESALHPDYIPLTDWRTYDLQQRHPDIIFFYNPYDGNNQVTSVHPNFYSNKLRRYTDLLCYVPYFVTSDNIADHGATCAGPLCADLVFVESQRVRDKYIRVFQQFEKNNHCEGAFGNAYDKFIASGHPKYDKVINAKREDYTIPDEWKRLMLRPDGTQKTVVLYNTNVLGLLDGNERFLSKLEQTLAIFKNRDDAVLWWRPHPLSDATFTSMRPQLAAAYKDLIKQYKSDGYGIYDDSPDPHRAMCLSSLYYGDGSSLLALYQCTGKPIMRHDVGLCCADSPGQNAFITALCDTGRHSWFLTAACNALFMMDKETRQVRYKGSFPAERSGTAWPYIAIVQVEDTLYFAPYGGEHIASYDMVTEGFQNIPVPPPKTTAYAHYYDKNKKFSDVFAHGEVLYFVPFTYPGILVYHRDSGRLAVLDGWVEALHKQLRTFMAGYALGHTVDDRRNRILLACRCANAVLEINPDTQQVQVHTVGDATDRYVDIYYDEGFCWLLCENKPALVRWDIARGDCKIFDTKLVSRYQEDMPPFSRIMRVGNRLLLMPMYAEKMVAFDLTEETMTVVDSFTPEAQTVNGYWRMLKATDRAAYFCSCPHMRLVTYEPVTGALREEGIRITDPADMAALREKQFFTPDALFVLPDDGIFMERPYATISDLLDILAQPETAARINAPAHMKALREKTIVHADGKAGKDIYTFCRNLVLH